MLRDDKEYISRNTDHVVARSTMNHMVVLLLYHRNYILTLHFVSYNLIWHVWDNVYNAITWHVSFNTRQSDLKELSCEIFLIPWLAFKGRWCKTFRHLMDIWPRHPSPLPPAIITDNSLRKWPWVYIVSNAQMFWSHTFKKKFFFCIS